MTRRGYGENTVGEDETPEEAFHFLYATKSKACFEMKLSPD
jgi:hypothetical protein